MIMFDRINKVDSDVLEQIQRYFGEIKELTERQKEDRVNLSINIVEVWLYIQTLVDVMLEYDAVDQRFIKEQLVRQFGDAVSQFVDLDSYLEDMIDDVAEDFVDPDEPKDEDAWLLKFEPAGLLGIALDSSQAVLNYKDYQEAIKQGMTYKTWKAFIDKRTRKDHEKINGKTIPIREYFLVGDVMMRFPHDWEYAGNSKNALRQLINCRCLTVYHK